MDWNQRRRRSRKAVGECDSVQHPAQAQVAKEHVMGKHEHAFSLPAEPRQNIQGDIKGAPGFADWPDKRDSPTNPGLSATLPLRHEGRFARDPRVSSGTVSVAGSESGRSTETNLNMNLNNDKFTAG